jgi:predicted metal-binding membrane protein
MYYTEHVRGSGEYRRPGAAPILIPLLVLTAIAWSVTVWNARAGGVLMMAGVPMSFAVTGRLSLASGVLFVSLWAVMMAAMMFPSVCPTVLTYAAVARKRDARGGSEPLFVAGYLLTWETFGVATYFLYVGAGTLLAAYADWTERLPLLIGAAVLLAGVYQFTGVKRECLAHCQSPGDHLAAHWRGGGPGAAWMGGVHGVYCLGCCSGLMLALVALGTMDLRWMATVSAVIAIEKLGPRSRTVPAGIGIGLVLLGIIVALWPHPHMVM